MHHFQNFLPFQLFIFLAFQNFLPFQLFVFLAFALFFRKKSYFTQEKSILGFFRFARMGYVPTLVYIDKNNPLLCILSSFHFHYSSFLCLFLKLFFTQGNHFRVILAGMYPTCVCLQQSEFSETLLFLSVIIVTRV